MKTVKILTVIALILLIAAGISIAYLSNVNGDRQASADADQDVITSDGDTEVNDSQETDNNVNAEAGTVTGEQSTGGDADQISTANEPAEKEEPELRFVAVGDIMPGRGVEYWIRKNGGYGIAFEKVSNILGNGDVVFGNLECPLTSSVKGLDKNGKIVLKAAPESVSVLTSAGFNLLSLANNHIMDYYGKGLSDTMELLDQNGILYAGAGGNIDKARKLTIIEKNGLKIGLLAYTDMADIVFAGDPYLSFAAGPEKSGVAPRNYEIIKEDIEKARDKVDLLAVSLHWGIEDSFKVTSEQVEFAHKLIDDGADIILGHHPHRFQGIEMYKGKPILYSMGNILFDQNESENMESFIVDMKYKGTELTELTATPVRILSKSYVEVQTGSDAADIINRQIELCRKLGTEPETVNDTLVFRQNPE